MNDYLVRFRFDWSHRMQQEYITVRVRARDEAHAIEELFNEVPRVLDGEVIGHA